LKASRRRASVEWTVLDREWAAVETIQCASRASAPYPTATCGLQPEVKLQSRQALERKPDIRFRTAGRDEFLFFWNGIAAARAMKAMCQDREMVMDKVR
jgi:hypothetical protein